jgi:hypothetical protein
VGIGNGDISSEEHLKIRKPGEVLISYLELYIFVQIYELFFVYFWTHSLKGVDFLIT